MQPLGSTIVQSPGILGLNTQGQDDIMDLKYATVADNCVIDRNGLLASRKGIKVANASAATGTPTIDVMHSYVQDDGTEIIISTGGNKIWSGTSTVTSITGSHTITADEWQFQNTQGNVIGCQASHQPIWWDGSGNIETLVGQNPDWQATTAYSLEDLVVPTTENGYYYECTTAGTSGGSQPTWSTTVGGTTADGTVVWTTREIPKSNVCLAAFGRLFIANADGNTIHYSDLLIPHAFSGGSSGSIDLNTVWPSSNDTITALAVHNNNLIILCKNSIIIYSSVDDITNIALVEAVTSNGCIARDSVQTIGNDLFYLSQDGVRTLSRTILQNNMPLGEVSQLIRDDVVTAIAAETTSLIKSTYNQSEGFYLINFPTHEQTYVCDVRIQGTPRWTNWPSSLPHGLCTGRDDTLYFGLDAGYVATYTGYLDADTSTGDTTETYLMKFRTGWMDVGLETVKAVWKKAIWYMTSEFDLSATSTWAFDFGSKEYSENKSLTGAPAAQYGIAQYGIDVYGPTFDKDQINVNLRGTGSIIKIGTQVAVNNGKFAFNKIALFFKKGRIR